MAYTRRACRTTIIAARALAVLATEASAQKSGGRSTAFYNSGGQNLGRGATSGSTTTFRDSGGRTTGTA